MRRPLLRSFLLLTVFLFTWVSADETEENNDVREKPEKPETMAEGKEQDKDRDHSGGFGTDIDWVPWPQAVPNALDLDRPIFLLIHKSWCGACQLLKKSFNESTKRKELVELSKKFVMANTEDEDEPEEDEYAPDGRYIPRLFILNKQGKRYPVDNRKNYPSNVAYFPQVPDVIIAMKKGLEMFEKEKRGEPIEEKEGKEEEEGKKKEKQGKKEEEKRDEDAEKKEKEGKKKEEAEGKKEKEAEGKKGKKNAESVGKMKKEDEAGQKAEDEAGKGGCPHAAGKAAKKKKEEEEKKAKEKGEGGEGKTTKEEKQQKTEKKKKTDEKKAEQQKEKKKKGEKEKVEL